MSVETCLRDLHKINQMISDGSAMTLDYKYATDVGLFQRCNWISRLQGQQNKILASLG